MATLFSLDFSTDATLDQPMVSGAPRTSLKRLENYLKALASGTAPATDVTVRNTGVKASGTVTLDASATGTLTTTINGVNIDVEWATDDATTATAIAAAINAETNALVQNLVTASASGLVVTITAVVPGKTGNAITTAASGTGITADQTRLTGGSESRFVVSF